MIGRSIYHIFPHNPRAPLGRCPYLTACALMLLLPACSTPDTREQPVSADTTAGLYFTEVTEQAGLSDFRHSTGATGKRWFPESMGSGGGFIDYNGDGWADIALMGGGRWETDSIDSLTEFRTISIYRNNRDGTFSDVSEAVGVAGYTAYGIGVSAADYDNDGDEDIIATTLGRNLLFRNDTSDSRNMFVEVGETAGLSTEKYWSSTAMFFDADRDGRLDLYVGNYVDWSPENDLTCMLEGMIRSYCTPELYKGVAANFYHNNGDGTFSNWSEEAGFSPSPGKTLGAAEFDVNGDGWPDLFIANDTQPDQFYLNNGDGTFGERGALSGMAYDENGKARAGMGIDIGIVDDTGEPTLFVGNFSKEMISAFRHTGDGLFLDRAAISQIGRSSLTTLTFGLFLFDADLDGDLDLFAANGHVQPEIEQTQEGIQYAEKPHLFINDGNGVFHDASSAAGDIDRAFVGRGAAYADYDRDGDLDVLLTENGGPAHLFRNDQTAGRSLRIHLQGRTSNLDGLSSKVVAYIGSRREVLLSRTGSSYLSVSEKTLTFGILPSERVDSLTIFWSSGQIDRHAGPFLDREIMLVEGEENVQTATPTASGEKQQE